MSGLRQSGGLCAQGASVLTNAVDVVDAADATAQALLGADQRPPNQEKQASGDSR